MWISRIELNNFKSYQAQSFELPKPNNDRNIVLIGGLNGYGKTSILEALYLCLYGKDAIVHLARAGLKTDESRGYPTFLEKAFNGEALREGRDTMSVRIVINKNMAKAIDIQRRWYFRPNGTWNHEEETIVREVVRGVLQSPKLDGIKGFLLSALLDDIFVPVHIAPFFFFDGEEVKKLADQSRIEQIKLGLEGLLGVALLRTLAERMRGYESKKRGDFTRVDEQKVHSLAEKIANDKQHLDVIKNQFNDVIEEQNRLRGERESLVERITASGGGGGDIATVKDLVELREQHNNKLREIQHKMEDILAIRLPFHLFSKDILSMFRAQIEAEIKYFTWEGNKQSLKPRKREFLKAFSKETKPIITPELTTEQFEAIKTRIETAWASLFYPPPDDCAKEIVHTYMNENQRQQVIGFLKNVQLGQQEVMSLLEEHNSQIQRIDELSRKISKLEGIDRDGTLLALNSELKNIMRRLDELSDEIRSIERKTNAMEAMLSSNIAEYEREKKKLDDSSPARAFIEKSERVRKVIDKVIPELFPLKAKQLAVAMTDFYKDLAHKNQVDKIIVNDDGSSKILGKSGKEISFDRSSGENQIFATALIAGLAKVSGVKAPMVVDTPLGRLDSKHRKNILRFWTGDKKRQIILLSQDEEIGYQYYKSIESSILKTFLLEHIDVGDGIGRTVAKEDIYFQRSRK